jgi:predicted kinase
MAEIYVVVGPPAVGKSSASRALCARFGRSVHIPVDDLRMMVSGGRVLPDPVWSDELALQVRLARESTIDMARRYQDAGFTVVVDDFVDPRHLVEYQALDGVPGVNKILLLPDQEVAHRRNAVRAGDSPDRHYIDVGIRHVYDVLATATGPLQRDGWVVVDTSESDVEGTVDALLALSAGQGGK